MFGKGNDVVGRITFDNTGPSVAFVRDKKPVFVEFEGALAVAGEDGKLEFTPRGKISINVANIGGYYDHTILLFGNKVRVMETAAQIGLKIMEAGK